MALTLSRSSSSLLMLGSPIAILAPTTQTIGSPLRRSPSCADLRNATTTSTTTTTRLPPSSACVTLTLVLVDYATGSKRRHTMRVDAGKKVVRVVGEVERAVCLALCGARARVQVDATDAAGRPFVRADRLDERIFERGDATEMVVRILTS